MIIKFSDLLAKGSRNKEIKLSFEFQPVKFEGEEIKAVSMVDVNGQVNSKDEILELKAHIKTNLELTCSRCLDTFIYPIDVDIEERFTKSKELQDDEELIFVEDDTLDIIQIVENCIISTLPIKRLCKEDCKGLCSQCGTNKNVKECQCDNYDVDIRLAKLRELFGE